MLGAAGVIATLATLPVIAPKLFETITAVRAA